jgi:predicted lactoylglutathione lyase
MLMQRDVMAGFTEKELGDPATTAQVQISISCESRKNVLSCREFCKAPESRHESG